MTSDSEPQIPRRPWTLLLGPGASLTECLPVLEALAPTRAEAPAALEQIGDWSELFSCLDEVGRMLVDADQFGLEHLGLLKAFLKRFPSWEVALLGRDPASRPLRELLRRRQCSWIPAPLDMDSMGWLLQPPSQLYGGRGWAGDPAQGHSVRGSQPGNIPPGYVTRSSGPRGTTSGGSAPTHGAPAELPQPPAGDPNTLALYDIPRADPEGDAPREVAAASARRHKYSREGGDSSPRELDEETEKQLLAEVERILVGSSGQAAGSAVALAPARTAAASAQPSALDEPTAPDDPAALENPAAFGGPAALENPAGLEAPMDLQEPPGDEFTRLEDPAPVTSIPSSPSVRPASSPAIAASPATREPIEMMEAPVEESTELVEETQGDLEDLALPTPDSSGPLPPAPFFKHQVADLADIVQCVDMGLDQAAEDVLGTEGARGERLAARFEQLCGEVARLRQYTRTLSFMASPPVAGDQRFDLAPMLEEMLTMRRSEEDAPRYLIRTPEPLPLVSDKLLLTQALDAFLFLCHACAGPEGTVRVDGRRTEDGDLRISMRFPAGQLADLEPAEILQPYALRRTLPELGPNSLAAAAGILAGQGGEVQLLKEPRGGLEWLIQLPSADGATR